MFNRNCLYRDPITVVHVPWVGKVMVKRVRATKRMVVVLEVICAIRKQFVTSRSVAHSVYVLMDIRVMDSDHKVVY